MSDSLIEQVKRLAEAQKAIPEGAQLEGTMYGAVDAAYFVQQASAFNFPALLAHMECTQAVVDAAREFMAADWFIDSEPMTAKELTRVRKLRVDLDAALSRIAALTGEKK